MRFWAHSDPHGLPPDDPKSKWQPLSEHLKNVGILARSLAQLAAPTDQYFQEMAACCGLLHDFGKYSDAFQRMITSGKGRCQHSVHGAAVAYFGAPGNVVPPKATHVALAIAGHHAGLPNLQGGESSLGERIKRFRDDAGSLVSSALADCPELQQILGAPFREADRTVEGGFDLFTRMLFSCLVDADRLDSSGQSVLQQALNAGERLQRLLAHIRQLALKTPEGKVKAARNEVLQDCLTAGEFPERLLSLTVPTGGGKTFASVACALKMADLKPDAYRRIIVVIPYLSIIEQNAERYEEVFGQDAVLEHHSGSFDRLVSSNEEHFIPASGDEAEKSYEAARSRPETENWDSPLIVTTSVRFFESVFSNRPSDLRRVHNIARSIIILDEVQTLPRRLLAPLLTMIKELADHWGCAFIFSTATQPAFQRTVEARPDCRWQPGTIREIVRRPDALRLSLKRVHIEWEIDTRIAWVELAGRLLGERQSLTVVNLRDHAGALFDAVLAQAPDSGFPSDAIFHLSTRMCAAHRLRAIETVRQRLKNNLPCCVVSTQLIEAGVDLDFPIVFRAMGPLDAIFQAAGRADREGLLTERLNRPGGRVVVFVPEDHRLPPNEYKEAAGKTEALVWEALSQRRTMQVDSAESIEAYFERYYGEGGEMGLDLQSLRTGEKHYQFATLAEEFEMISSRTRDVFVPYDATSRAAIDELRHIKRLTRELRRRLQRYVVGLYPTEFVTARGVLEEIVAGEIWVVVPQAYSAAKGLKFELQAEDFLS